MSDRDLQTAEIIARLDFLERELEGFARSLRTLRIDLFNTLDHDPDGLVD